MPAPATKISQLIAKLADSVPPSQFELHVMLRELAKLKKMARHTQSLAEVHLVIGAVNLRLGKFDDALVACRIADGLCSTAATKTNVGAALLGLHQPMEAVGHLAEAANLDDRRLDTLLNLCSCLSQLGSVEDARAVFARALEVARFDQPRDLFQLAAMASSSGYDAEAVELLARALALRSGQPLGDRDPIEVIRETPAQLGFDLTHMPVLAAAIDRTTALGPEVQRLAMLPSRTGDVPVAAVDPHEAEAEVIAWTKPYRDRATAATLDPDER